MGGKNKSGASKFRHKITIERLSSDLDELGQSSDVWTAIAKSRPASVQDLSGRDLERARQNVPDATVSVETRWTPGLDASARIRFRDRILHVAAVIDPEQRRQVVICLCGERRT